MMEKNSAYLTHKEKRENRREEEKIASTVHKPLKLSCIRSSPCYLRRYQVVTIKKHKNTTAITYTAPLVREREREREEKRGAL